jgi:hypothetical protein
MESNVDPTFRRQRISRRKLKSAIGERNNAQIERKVPSSPVSMRRWESVDLGENQPPVIFKPTPVERLPKSPLEDALVNGKAIAFYIPSLEYKESALHMLAQRLKLLAQKGIPIPEPKYEFVIGSELVGWNGDLDSQNRVIIHSVGVARLG